ncbi:conserved hypothetical protein [Vibrio chagasii]|nr:conserved hypothetical protein [Vibrio chagasii]
MSGEFYRSDVLGARDWQRSNAEIFKKLVQNKQDWLDEYHNDFWTSWYDDVFNLDTANEFGLTVWSIILDEPVYSEALQIDPGTPAFGLGAAHRNFNRSIFGINPDGFILSLEQKRILLKLKAYCLHSTCSVKRINQDLAAIFGEGHVVCFDNLDMSITYFFNDNLPKRQRNEYVNILFLEEILRRDLFPRPSAVEVNINVLSKIITKE